MNIELYEGQGALLYITLNGDYVVYGGSDENTFGVCQDGNVYTVVIYPHSRGVCSNHRFDIFAKNDKHMEWLVASGKITVNNRQSATRGNVISPVEYHLEVELVEGGKTETKQMIVGIPGKQGEAGLSAYELAVKHGFEGSEKEWLSSFQKGEQGEKGKRATKATLG